MESPTSKFLVVLRHCRDVAADGRPLNGTGNIMRKNAFSLKVALSFVPLLFCPAVQAEEMWVWFLGCASCPIRSSSPTASFSKSGTLEITMKLKNIHIWDFKRFADLSIDGLPSTIKLVLLTGPNGSGKTSLFEAFNFWMNYAKQSMSYEQEYYERSLPAQTSNIWDAILQKIQLEFHGVPAQRPQAHNRKDFYIRSAYRHKPFSAAITMLVSSR
jgi:hypothetical protein